MTQSEFRNSIPYEQRIQESKKIIEKYSDRIPCIVENAKNCTLPTHDKKKFLVPRNVTMGQFLYIIRRKFKLSPDKAIFIFVNGSILVPSSTNLNTVYSDNKNDDGFLYLVISDETTFGC